MRFPLVYLLTVVMVIVGLTFTGCESTQRGPRNITLAVNSGVEGDALKQAALDYEAQTGVHIEIAEFPYANLFEKELTDLTARTGAYDLIMLDDPWFPKLAYLLSDLAPLMHGKAINGPDPDFVETSI
ncbi:MAG: extracellular solute-binding protein, partial [Pyrinomonadaceae bacterium]